MDFLYEIEAAREWRSIHSIKVVARTEISCVFEIIAIKSTSAEVPDGSFLKYIIYYGLLEEKCRIEGLKMNQRSELNPAIAAIEKPSIWARL